MSIAGFQQNKVVNAVITTPPTKTTYYPSDTFIPTGMEITLTYEDGTTSTVNEFNETDEGFLISEGDTYVQIILFDQGQTIKIQQPITVQNDSIVGSPITISDQTISISSENEDYNYQVYENNELLGTLLADGTWVPSQSESYAGLTFIASSANSTISMGSQSGSPTGVSLETSFDGVTWTSFIPGETVIRLDNIGDKVFFRGNNPSRFSYSSNYYKFIMTGLIKASGNIMSLIDNGACNTLIIPCAYCFTYLFYGCTALQEPPELPATTLTNYCYEYMFQNCTSLLSSPLLPAEDISGYIYYCYANMFNGCTSLVNARPIKAKKMAYGTCSHMFFGCTALKIPPIMYLENAPLASSSCESMFEGCTSLQKIPVLYGPALASTSFSRFFYGCTSLYVSSTQTDVCPYPWTIPFNGICTISTTQPAKYMFTKCQGTRTDNSVNFSNTQVTYYVQYPPVGKPNEGE